MVARAHGLDRAAHRRMYRHVAPLLLLSLLLTMVSAGCSPSKFRYVSNSSAETYLKVPRGWTEYSGTQLFDAEAQVLAQQGQSPPSELDRRLDAATQWRMVFDSDPNPRLEHALGLSVNPTVEVRVRLLEDSERDKVNNASLRNLVYNYDELRESARQEEAVRPLGAPDTIKNFREILDEELKLDGGVRGVHQIFEVRGDDDNTYILNQTVLVDAEAERIYLLLVRSGEQQYIANRDLINEIVDSFTIKKKV